MAFVHAWVRQRVKIICFLFGPNVGGPHIRACAIYSRMAEQGHVARIAIPAGPGTAESFFHDAGITVDRLAIRKPVSPSNWRGFAVYLVSIPLGVARTMAYLRRHRPDVIHVNGAFDLVPGLAGRLAGIPVVWHLNDTFLPRLAARLMGWTVTLLASRVVVAAKAVGRHYGVNSSSAEVIYAPVDTERFLPRDLADRPATPPIIGLLGNWNPLKGQDRFVEVIRRLKAEGYPVRAVMLGYFLDTQKTYWQPILDRIEKEGLKEDIECNGFVIDPVSALRQFDLLLLTSRSEACPMSVLEAMSVGVPQVCFRVGGVDEIVGTHDGLAETASDPDSGPAGIVVPEGDIDEMVKMIRQILAEPECYRRSARAGQKRARALYSLEACVARHNDVYRSAIGEIGRSA